MQIAARCRSFFRIGEYGCCLWLLLCLLSIFASCGRKALPVPPGEITPLPAVMLEGAVVNGQAELSWRLNPKDTDLYSEIDSFYLYGATSPRLEEGCLNCPKSFKLLAEISPVPHLKRPDGQRLWRHDIPVDSDLKHIFKINIRSSGKLGPDSNYVELEP